MTFAVLALLGCSGGHVEGTVVDGLTGQPVAATHLLLTAKEKTGMSCMGFDVITDANGHFAIDGTCAVPYTARLSGDELWLAEGDEIPAEVKAPLALTAWRNPSASGVYIFSKGAFEPLRTVTDVKTRPLFGTDQKAVFPSKLPDKLPLLEAGQYLVIVGKENAAAMAPVPLVPAGPIHLDQGGTSVEQSPWVYLGARLSPGATPGTPDSVEPVEVAFDKSKVIAKSKGERAVEFVGADALPPGRYALLKPGDKRIYVVDFMVAGPAPGAPPPEAATGGEGPAEAPPGAPPSEPPK
jgi:hypothetical protein